MCVCVCVCVCVYIHIVTHILFRLFSIIGYYEILNIVSCVLNRSCCSSILYIECLSVNPKLIIYSFSKKIRDIKGIFHARMGTIKDRNSKDLTEAEEIKKR